MQRVPRNNLDIISGGYFNSSTSRGGSQEISHDIAEIDDVEGSYSHMTCSRCVRMPNGSRVVGMVNTECISFPKHSEHIPLSFKDKSE